MKWGLNRISFIRTYAHKDLYTRPATMEAGSVVEGDLICGSVVMCSYER